MNKLLEKPTPKKNNTTNIGIEIGATITLTIFILLLLLLSGCVSTYTPAEERCLKAGLRPERMKIAEDFTKAQEVIIECTKKPISIPDLKKAFETTEQTKNYNNQSKVEVEE